MIKHTFQNQHVSHGRPPMLTQTVRATFAAYGFILTWCEFPFTSEVALPVPLFRLHDGLYHVHNNRP